MDNLDELKEEEKAVWPNKNYHQHEEIVPVDIGAGQVEVRILWDVYWDSEERWWDWRVKTWKLVSIYKTEIGTSEIGKINEMVFQIKPK